MTYENRLVPSMRDGVEVVKMIFFKRLKAHLAQKYPGRGGRFAGMLAGAIINELFGTPNSEEEFARFAGENRRRIEEELKGLAENFQEMRIPLTDALRVQFVCDDMEGMDSKEVLLRARDLGVLIVEREVPLPRNFLGLVRRLGRAFDILASDRAPGERPG